MRRSIQFPGMDFFHYERSVLPMALLETNDWMVLNNIIYQINYLKDSQEMLKASGDESLARQFNLYLLNCFFVTPYRAQEDFYPQFYARLAEAKQQML